MCGEFDWQTWGHIQKQIDVNFVGTLRVTKFCLPLLKAGEGEGMATLIMKNYSPFLSSYGLCYVLLALFNEN